MHWSWLLSALLACSHCAVFGQRPLGEAYWQAIRAKADSVLVAEFGKEFREKYIFEPMYPLDYVVVDDNGISWSKRDTISHPPQWCYFEYCLGVTKSSAILRIASIRFTITPEGRRVPASMEPNAEWDGFVNCDGICRIAHDGAGFVKLARDHGVKAKRKDGFGGVEWIPPDSLELALGKRTGRYELTLQQDLHKEGEIPTSGGGAFYWRLYKIAVFDLFTGDLLRVEEVQQTYKIACGLGRL